MQVFIEYRGIQRVPLEGTAHEEGAAATQYPTYDRHIEVDAGSDVRWCQTVAEQQVGQQQVVDMAAMAWHIDDFVAMGEVAHGLQVIDLDALVELVPEPAEHRFEEADGGVGVVRGDLVAVAQGLCLGLLDADLFPFGLFEDGLAH